MYILDCIFFMIMGSSYKLKQKIYKKMAMINQNIYINIKLM